MRSALGVVLATLGGAVIAFGSFGLATTIATSEPFSFGATAIIITSIAPLAAVGIILVYGASTIARWSRRSRIFGIVALISGTSLVLIGLILKMSLIFKFVVLDSPPDVDVGLPFLSAGGVLLGIGAVLVAYERIRGRGPFG
jgi:hypothetical protein